MEGLCNSFSEMCEPECYSTCCECVESISLGNCSRLGSLCCSCVSNISERLSASLCHITSCFHIPGSNENTESNCLSCLNFPIGTALSDFCRCLFSNPLNWPQFWPVNFGGRQKKKPKELTKEEKEKYEKRLRLYELMFEGLPESSIEESDEDSENDEVDQEISNQNDVGSYERNEREIQERIREVDIERVPENGEMA